MYDGPNAARLSAAGMNTAEPSAPPSAWWLAAKTTGARAPGAPTALRALLDPDATANRPVLRSLAGHAGRILTDRVRQQMADGAAQLGAGRLRVVFGGHFSCGKSSMINMLIGRPLLPTSDYPETGVPCVISAGAADGIQIVAGARERAVPFGTASIAAAVTLVGADGDYRAVVKENTRLDVTLASGPIGPDTVWVDSPGINDTAEMTARATAVANEADVLVWLVNSKQSMSEAEQAVLREHVATHGPAGVVFLVNAFLEVDTLEDWERFLRDQAPAHAARIEAGVDTGAAPKRIVFASARAAAEDPDRFGGPEARALLAEMTGSAYWRATATRACRARAGLTRLGERLDQQVSEEEARLTAARAEQAETVGQLGRQHRDFLGAVGGDVRHVLARQREAADAAVQAAAAMVDATARTDNFYGQDLTTRLQVVADTITAEIATAIDAQARRYRQAALAASARHDLAVLLSPEPVTIAGLSASGFGKSVAIGAGTGLAAGTVVPVLGHAVGPVIGAVIGGFRAKASRQQRVTALRAEVSQAGNAAVTAMCGSQDAITALVERGYPAPSAQRGPDQRRLTSLRKARTHLNELTAALSEVAGPAAAGDAGPARTRPRAARTRR
jgi:hypothetical protein